MSHHTMNAATYAAAITAIIFAAGPALAGEGMHEAVQPLVHATPNLLPAVITPAGTSIFAFSHRFAGGDSDGGVVAATPVFDLAYGLTPFADAKLTLAMMSAVNPEANRGLEGEALGRFRLMPAAQPLQLAVAAGYNSAAISADGALIAHYDLGPARLVATAKAFSSGFGVAGPTVAAGAGAAWHLNPNWSLGADVSIPTWSAAGATSTDAAWSVGTNMVLPYTPHSLQLYATNTASSTLQGATLATPAVRIGFSFSILLGDLQRYREIVAPNADV